ncbi:phosphatidylinositol transfer protein 3-like [Salvia hispanica]|uniref:phosphatidylinositol transfer protein 3-like n=1 Tax=Salvia hispanica TaxID=49212 RepID=UPI002009B6BA|nr:phosphatidylinositol transfer protein 3-like [Salvia hispanica]XP_047983238.1 phosphatidylinositol transfer protein 3-like [Salvia hispanica]
MSAGEDESLSRETQQAKITEVRKSIGPLTGKLAIYCSDGCIARYLRARNWNSKKAIKMLKASLKWRSEYMPEEIRWDDVAVEAETGKIYRSSYKDKHGRPVLVMRPRCQNTNSIKGQIKYLVYCMENAILNLGEEQEQMVWLIDFHGFSLSNVSLKVTKDTAHVLQNHYPERLGVAILYDAPKIFEPFWKMAKPFLEPKTANKVKFVYSDDPNTNKIMDELFDMGMVESAFGGKHGEDFDINKYATRMRKDDEKLPFVWGAHHSLISPPPVSTGVSSTSSDSDPEAFDMKEEKAVISSDEDKGAKYY